MGIIVMKWSARKSPHSSLRFFHMLTGESGFSAASFANSLSRAPCWSGRTYTDGEKDAAIGIGGVFGISKSSIRTVSGNDDVRRPSAETAILPSYTPGAAHAGAWTPIQKLCTSPAFTSHDSRKSRSGSGHQPSGVRFVRRSYPGAAVVGTL